jgi:hypothetical protein
MTNECTCLPGCTCACGKHPQHTMYAACEPKVLGGNYPYAELKAVCVDGVDYQIKPIKL